MMNSLSVNEDVDRFIEVNEDEDDDDDEDEDEDKDEAAEMRSSCGVEAVQKNNH